MKKCFFLLILIFIVSAACRTSRQVSERTAESIPGTGLTASVNFMEPSTWLLGYIDPALFSRFPHSEWYTSVYDTYQPDQEIIGKMSIADKEQVLIQIVMGTWCSDSRREVPRFMKIMDLWGFNKDNITIIGVDDTKLAPIGGYEDLGIERVPTFIIMENKVEKGRIIEYPISSLEQDMLNILTRSEK